MSHKSLLIIFGIFLSICLGLATANQYMGQGRLQAAPLADPVTNIACLPFPESDITAYNGQSETAAVNTHDQTTVTWKDDAGTAEEYIIERRTVSSWTEIATVSDTTRVYTDTGLDDTLYDYRVWRVVGGEKEEVSDYCTRPDYVQSAEFIVFYRLGPTGCPSVDDGDGSNRGTCVTSVTTANDILDYLERSRAGFTSYMNFQDPFNAGNTPYPVDLFPCDGVGGARSGYICLTPGSMEPSTFNAGTGDGQTAVWTVLHEVFHKVQGQYGTWSNTEPDRKWITEGTARTIQDKICIGPNAGDCISLDDVDPSGYNNQVIKYLTQSHHENLLDASYNAALFWTKAEEICDDPGSNAAERDVDFLLDFFEKHESFPNSIGRDVVSQVMTDCGVALNFQTLFQRFAVSNYAKDFSGGPSIYHYEDEATMTNGYGPVTPDYTAVMDGSDELVGSGWVQPWAARYLELELEPGVTNIDISINQALSNQLYYHVLAIQGNNIPDEFSDVGPDFNLSIPNDGYDKVVVVIVGQQNGDFFDYAINVVNPQVNILDPLNGRKAQAGLPTDPEKILVKVDVTNADAEKIAGIDPVADFTVTIGAEQLDLSDDEVLISYSYIQGQYWLLLRAPNQAANGTYDLTVSYATSTDTETDAVEYGPVPETSNVVAIDRSGSMDDFDKMGAAQDAGRLYIDTWDTGDQIGVVAFGTVDGEQTAVLLGLTNWTNNNRDTAHMEIDDLEALGTQTPIGAGLIASLQELIDHGESDHDWAIVLLSDGLETVQDVTIDDFLDDYETRKDDGDQVPRVHTVALGPDADFEAMQRIADKTGGEFHYAANVPDALALFEVTEDAVFVELAEIYRIVSEEVAGQQQIFSEIDTMPLPDRDHFFNVESGARELVIAFNSSAEIADWTDRILLIDPNLVQHAPVIGDDNHRVWRILQPDAGQWRMALRNFPETGEYLVEAALRSDVRLEGYLGLPQAERWAGKPMPILVSLSEAAPILNGDVDAVVMAPDGQEWPLALYDDGFHGDGAADDGFYGTTFYHTQQPGAYIVKLSANGTAPLAGSFNRLARLSFSMSEQPDDDDDGMPTWWEAEYDCLNTAVNDATTDTDNDGLTAVEELFYGTHPCDADTDDGGESDGSEINVHFSDPHFAPDDRPNQPTAKAWPGNGEVTLIYDLPSNYSHMRIYRGVGESGLLSLVADNVVPTGEWLDTAVVNDTTYCYEVVGVVSGFSSAPSVKSCATPSVDPVPPPSTAVLIDDDAPHTNSARVRLTLYASDNPHSHEEQEEEHDPAIPENTIPSGVADMMISNNPDFAGAVWEPYVNEKEWVVRVAHGRAVVYVKFRDQAGNESDVAVDVIYADPMTFLPIIMR